MAKAMCCDRCGKTSKEDDSYNNFTELNGSHYISLTQSSAKIDFTADLCDDCIKDLKNFIFERKVAIKEFNSEDTEPIYKIARKMLSQSTRERLDAICEED